MKTGKMFFPSAASRLFMLFILLASLLVLPKAHAAIGDTFTIDHLKYTVLTEEPVSQTGTVSVQAESTEISGVFEIPSPVVNEGNNYSVTSIPDEAFKYCRGIDSMVIPDSVTSIGNYAFYFCSSLTSIIIPDSVTSIYDSTFGGCSNLTSIVIPDSVTSIKNGAFYGCSSLTNAIIGNSVTSIGEYAFYFCSSLISIIIPDSVTSIYDSAFYGCRSLTNAIMGNSVTSIGNYAFDGCSSLTSIVIPDSVTSIGEYAFDGCSSLTSIVIPDSVTSIGDRAFYWCTSLTSIVIPDSVTSIYDSTFAGCSSLISIIIPDSVTFIGYGAFYSCNGLTAVYFEGNAPSVGEDVFFNAPSVIYYRPGTTGWTNPWCGRPTALWIEFPEIIEQPQSQAVMEGDPVTFSVVAKGAEPLSYQWYKEGVAIENATGTSYTIESVSAEDLGNYTVTVSNESGVATSTVATLTLKIPYRATGTVQVVDGSVAGLTVTDGGWGYTRAPNIRIIDETGSGATGHCVIENGVVTQIILDHPGTNYSGEATVLIGSPFSNTSLDIAVSEVKVKMHLVLGMEYQLWSSVDCINWEQAGEPFIAEEEEMTFFFKVEDYGRFFKLQEIQSYIRFAIDQIKMGR